MTLVLRRPDLWLPPLALMALIFFLSDQPDLSSGLGAIDLIGRKLLHAAEYALLCLLWWRALEPGLGARRAALAGLGIAVAYAVTDEVHQSFVDGRHATPVDVLIDSAGAAAMAAILRRRSAELVGKLRARSLVQRTIEAENRVRREIAQMIHDGPVQELSSLEMMLSAAQSAAEKGDAARLSEIMSEARMLVSRNVQALRDELISLGPYALDELSFDVAVERCADLWERRYGFDVRIDIERVDLPSEICGGLFGITQEAVVNAGRHAKASSVAITLDASDGVLRLSVRDDGQGLGGVDPLGPGEPGHIGLANMRERAELLGGDFTIASEGGGTEVAVTLPLATPQAPRGGL